MKRRFVTTPLRTFGALGIAIATLPLLLGGTARAAIVPTVALGTAGNYSVLAGQTVTNTGTSTFAKNVGVSPGSSITGFPPGVVTLPATIDATTATAAQAQLDLTAAYLAAAGRPVNATVAADLTGLTLQGGVYAATSKGALSLSGALTLDAAGNEDTVFVFQTDSSLITASGSTINLINGAQQCNVFWQVGSSATLGSGSTMVGNVMALTTVTIQNGVTVHGRALARNGEVTLIGDTFTNVTCASATMPATGAAGHTTLWLAAFVLVVGTVATAIALRRHRAD